MPLLPPLHHQGTDEERAAASLALCVVLEVIRVSAVALSPITPSLSRKVFQQLGYTDAQFEVSSNNRSSWKETRWFAQAYG